MPGDVSAAFATGMKRSYSGATAPSYGAPHAKKRKVVRRLHHAQPIQHIVEPVNAEFSSDPEYKDFFDKQLRRAIAVECKGIGFDGAKPEAMEMFKGLVDEFMRNFLAEVRKSMSNARRTTTTPHDWVYALIASDLPGSGTLAQHFDTGDIPPRLLQPSFAPPEPSEEAPVPLEPVLGPALSGVIVKDEQSWIPKHFPPYPPKYTWNFTPVYTQRENDPGKIRAKATAEGIQAEQSLRKLMAAQKAGLQENKLKKSRQSIRTSESDALWRAAMEAASQEEAERAQQLERAYEEEDSAVNLGDGLMNPRRRFNLEEGVHVNYDRKFWRRSARGAGSNG
ncbi:transcription factor TFIID complex subunit 8 C-term-domain-containing protein [Lophiotrema nucula]|uniref:Transcription initiation factor TFIID subunit 8 n=1 Tax=Lophiotrema nucula TaxID=690887 RepID=A0A6A5YHB9_9PLEO|nr:transcription factor TFIID complex subunit 8 C-term-domain-containing protein [Lophiotrema nucula]